MRRNVVTFVLVLALALAVGVGCTVTSTRRSSYGLMAKGLTLDQLLAKTQAVAQVTVLGGEPQYDAQDEMVYTFSKVRVDRVVAGELKVGDVITLRVRGGSVDGHYTEPMPEFPALTSDSQHIMFLAYDEDGFHPGVPGWYIAGGWQGRAEIGVDGELHLNKAEVENPMRQWEGKSPEQLMQAVARRGIGRKP